MTSKFSLGEGYWEIINAMSIEVDGEFRTPDVVLSTILGHRSVHSVRQSIQRRASSLGECGTLPKSGSRYLLNTLQIFELIRKSRRPAAMAMLLYLVQTSSALMRGEIRSPNAAVTIALQDAVDGIEQLSPALRQFLFGGLSK